MTADERFSFSIDDRVQDRPHGTTNEIIEGPVSDYATDFDHHGAEWVADPFPIIKELRERCPIAHTDRYGGGWLPTRHDDVAAVAYDTERFTSRSVIMGNNPSPASDRTGRDRPTDLLGSAVPPWRSTSPAPSVRAAGHRQARAGRTRLLQRAARRRGGTRRRRRGR